MSINRLNQLFKAELVLKSVGKDITNSNLAKAIGVSKPTIARTLKKHSIFIINNRIFTLTKPYNTGCVTPYGNIHPTPYVAVRCNIHLFTLLDLDIFKVSNPINLRIIKPEKVISACLHLALNEEKYFHHNMSYSNKVLHSKAIHEVAMNVISSNGIHSHNRSYKFLQAQDKKYNFSSLFERYGSYVVGVKGYKQRLTPYMKDVVMKKVVDIFLGLTYNESKPINDDFILPFSAVKEINYRDLFYMLSLCTGVTKDGYVIRNDVKDTQFSRVYNVFTSIKSDTRNKLGWINYDMSAALQTIALNILGTDKYPEHKKLMQDKHKFRGELMESLNKTLPEIKQILSAADNGKQYKSLRLKSNKLNTYIIESEKLATDFNKNREANTPLEHKRALQMAKPISKFTGKYNRNTGAKIFKFSKEKNQFSVFFFNWTQIERLIREVMISMIKGKYQEVHDAVYCKEVISIPDMEEKIYNELGLSIKIEK